jgi:hypothetical protein
MKLNNYRLKAGIAAYQEEREMIERFLSESKSKYEFDEKFGEYPTGRVRKGGLPDSGFILGDWMESYGHLSWWIDLLNYMVWAGNIVVTTIDGVRHFQTNV